MNELIMGRNVGVKNVLESMKYVLALYEDVTGKYRPMLNGERYLTDDETSKALKVSRRTLQEYRNNGVIPYYVLGGKILYRVAINLCNSLHGTEKQKGGCLPDWWHDIRLSALKFVSALSSPFP